MVKTEKELRELIKNTTELIKKETELIKKQNERLEQLIQTLKETNWQTGTRPPDSPWSGAIL